MDSPVSFLIRALMTCPTLIVPANTSSPTHLGLGFDSPVNEDSLKDETPEVTVASDGGEEPCAMVTISPTSRKSTGIRRDMTGRLSEYSGLILEISGIGDDASISVCVVSFSIGSNNTASFGRNPASRLTPFAVFALVYASRKRPVVSISTQRSTSDEFRIALIRLTHQQKQCQKHCRVEVSCHMTFLHISMIRTPVCCQN